MNKVNVGIIGATGYVGAELIRLLLKHPKVTLVAISSNRYQGVEISQIYPAYHQICDLFCEDQKTLIDKADVIFAALPHGLSQELAEQCYQKNKLFIDMGADFRLKKEEDYNVWYGENFINYSLHQQAVYGLPELYKESIKGAKLIANPGCYTTAVPLALAPAIIHGFIEKEGIIADCKSGVTGAGRAINQNNHYPELNEDFYAYKVANHRHTPEIEQTLQYLFKEDIKISFVPHLLPINRGILATCYGKLKKGSQEEIYQVYKEFYQNEPFIRVLKNGQLPHLKYVKYTNYCDISIVVDERTNTLICLSSIDNMVKGAAGQAIQNMNIALEFEETTGLDLIPPAF